MNKTYDDHGHDKGRKRAFEVFMGQKRSLGLESFDQGAYLVVIQSPSGAGVPTIISN
jgi:hypothetical protein